MKVLKTKIKSKLESSEKKIQRTEDAISEWLIRNESIEEKKRTSWRAERIKLSTNDFIYIGIPWHTNAGIGIPVQ